MNYIPLILEIAALVCFILAAINVPSTKLNLGWTGAALLTAVLLIGALK